jgi:proton-dependent oligopeptide transporter, POT family
MSTQTAPVQSPSATPTNRFPPGIPYIVGNEGAERFSFYGMRQILYIHLSALFLRFVAEDAVSKEALADANVRATQVTHMFMAAVYLVPLIGALLADRFLGKYRVIFWVSMLYVAGHAVLAVAGRSATMGAFAAAEVGMFIGLGLIALGSGGIKPCVSANVGDQFTKENSHLVGKVFQIFYFIINFGSFFASILTPMIYYADAADPLNERTGPEWAFGVPGILMAIAAVVFWMGRNKFVKVPAKPGGKLGFLDFVSSAFLATPLLVVVLVGSSVAEHVVNAAMSEEAGAVGAAFAHIAATYWPHALVAIAGFALGLFLFRYRQKLQPDSGFLSVLLYSLSHKGERQAGEDFWAPARKKFGEEAADGPPAVLRIIVVFSMVSVFWALFDQHSSTWVQQAKAMVLSFDAPRWIWYGFALPATLVSAAFGAVWLFMWVSNRTMPRKVNLAVLGLGVLWAVVSVVFQLVNPDGGASMSTINMSAAQISALNPLMVMMIIPLLNVAVYDPLDRRGRPLKPLTRMTIGMFMAALAFASVAILQLRIESSEPNTIHVLWQVIPYFIMTTAEVLVSITGLEFAYTQAPRSMKSTIMGFWLLCVSFGNILVAFLAPFQKLSLSSFFWIFAALMAAASVVFMLLAMRYKGKTYLQESR